MAVRYHLDIVMLCPSLLMLKMSVKFNELMNRKKIMLTSKKNVENKMLKSIHDAKLVPKIIHTHAVYMHIMRTYILIIKHYRELKL